MRSQFIPRFDFYRANAANFREGEVVIREGIGYGLYYFSKGIFNNFFAIFRPVIFFLDNYYVAMSN